MRDFWTDADIDALDAAADLEETAAVAIQVLERMREEGDTIVQLCGPMTTGGLGSIDLNMARFEWAVRAAQARGLAVFDQLPLERAIVRLSDHRDTGIYNMDLLEILYRRIFESGHVERALFLSDWESSRGATWERNLVSSLGIAVEDYPAEWLEDTLSV